MAALTNAMVKPETTDERIARRKLGRFTAEEELVLREWEVALGWDVILDLNREYLRREKEFTPIYLDPIQDETLPMVPALLSLHDYGIFTHSSQPARMVGPVEDQHDPPWYQIQQRAYLTFVVPKGQCPCEGLHYRVIDKSLDELMADTNFHTNIIASDGMCNIGSCHRGLKLRNNFPMKWATHLQKEAESEELLKTAAVQERQFFQVDCTCRLTMFKSRAPLFDHMNPYFVHVLAKTWEDTDLPVLVKAAAVRAGMRPIFAREEEQGIPELGGLELREDSEDSPDMPDLETLQFDQDDGDEDGPPTTEIDASDKEASDPELVSTRRIDEGTKMKPPTTQPKPQGAVQKDMAELNEIFDGEINEKKEDDSLSANGKLKDKDPAEQKGDANKSTSELDQATSLNGK